MKMRYANHLLAIFCVLLNILALIAVLTGMHTVFGIAAVSISLAVSIGMYLRVLVGTAAMQVAEKQDELVDIAIAQKKDLFVVNEFANWMKNKDFYFHGARMVDLLRGRDEIGEHIGYWLLMVGTRKTYEEISKEATVLDYWPVNYESWAEELRGTYLPDFQEEEIVEPEDDAIPELKG